MMIINNTYSEEKRCRKDQRKKGRFEDQRPEVKKLGHVKLNLEKEEWRNKRKLKRLERWNERPVAENLHDWGIHVIFSFVDPVTHDALLVLGWGANPVKWK
jgi:hypothetical protein